MYRCPNCSAGMRYDIYKRSLKCDYCGYLCAAENHPQQQEEAARDDYEVTLFSCPQCGGQIRSTDNAATDFCSYCGASVVLEGRLVNEKKPAYIIPFSRTKEECKEVFKKRAKKAWCLPNAYKDPKKLEKFTGIYIPYWVYDVSQHAEPTVQGVRRAGAYTEYCNMNLEINLNYRWIYYDAALGFSDDLSDMISDYSSKDIEKFCGAYLSGFYADSPDVKEATYIEDAALVSCDSTIATAKKKYTDVYFEKVIDPLSTFNVQVEDARMALFPVWFCTWRNKGRVSYAVVNGQTLKAAADLPVSFPKFLFYSLLFAVPFAVLFLFLPSITPQVTLWVYLLVGMWTILQNYSTAMAYVRRESHLTDKGRLLSTESGWKLWKKGHDKKMEKMAEEKRRAEWKKSAEEAERKRKTETGEEEESSGCGSCLLVFVLPVFISGFLSLAFLQVFSNTPDNLPTIFVEEVTPFIAIILSIAIPILIIKGTTPKRLLLTILPDTLFLSAAVAAASCVMMTRPVKDLYYYIAALAVFAGILVGYLAIFHRFNLSCTRPIPNYHERGGQMMRKNRAVGGCILAVLISIMLPCVVLADSDVYQNTETGYVVRIEDYANLLSAEEEAELAEDMKPITKYGNAAFVSLEDNNSSTVSYAENHASEFIGSNGSMFLIDMDNREIYIYSKGEVWGVVTNSKARSITDNVYQYASTRHYYSCASEAFRQITEVLEGGGIPEPMKMISGILLSLWIGVIINFHYVQKTRIQEEDENLPKQIVHGAGAGAGTIKITSTDVYKRVLGGGGSGGGGGGSFGGGGGSSGGGGGHSF